MAGHVKRGANSILTGLPLQLLFPLRVEFETRFEERGEVLDQGIDSGKFHSGQHLGYPIVTDEGTDTKLRMRVCFWEQTGRAPDGAGDDAR